MNAMRTVRWGIALLVAALWCGVAAAQQPKEEPSLAEAARRTREQKARQPKAKRAWTNDTLPSAGAVSTVGEAPPTPSTSNNEEAAPSTEAATREAGAPDEQAEKAEKERGAAEADLSQVQEQLASAQSALELLSRDFDLMRQQFYSNPGYSSDSAGKARLDALESQVNAKRQEIEALKQKLSKLGDKVKTLGASAPPKKEEPASPEKERERWAAKVRPLRDEQARVEAEISRIRSESARSGLTINVGTTGGSMASNMIGQLENRRRELQAQIGQIEDDARRAGIPPAALR